MVVRRNSLDLLSGWMGWCLESGHNSEWMRQSQRSLHLTQCKLHLQRDAAFSDIVPEQPAKLPTGLLGCDSLGVNVTCTTNQAFLRSFLLRSLRVQGLGVHRQTLDPLTGQRLDLFPSEAEPDRPPEGHMLELRSAWGIGYV